MNKFAKRLKELRIEKGLSQNKLAKTIGVSTTAVRLWENNERTPTIDAIILLVNFFGVSSDYLIGITDI